MSVKEPWVEIQATRTTLELLYNISREIAAALDLRTLLQRVVSLAMKHVGAISGSMIVLDERGQPIESAIIVGERIYDSVTQQLRVTIERGLAGWVLRNQQAALIPDTSKDERWLQRPDDAPDKTGPKSAVCAPILARDQLVGIITLVHSTPNSFHTDHLELVQAIADQAGIAALNARLYAESQRNARVMTSLAKSAPYRNHFRFTNLPQPQVIAEVFGRIEELLGNYAAGDQPATRPNPALRVVDAGARG